MGKVLMTGVYGFLGRCVARGLLVHGYEVVAFGGKRDKFKALRVDGAGATGPLVGDFCKQGDITATTKDMGFVIHAGALSTVWGKRSDFMETNVRGAQRVICAYRQDEVKHLVFVSPPSIYVGKCGCLDTRGMDYDTLNCLNYYIESRILAEKVSREQRGVPCVIICSRGLSDIGDSSIIPRSIKANRRGGILLFRDGHNLVDAVCVENVALALRPAIESEAATREVYNITNSEPREFRIILEELFWTFGEKPRCLRLPLSLLCGVVSLTGRAYRLFRLNGEPPFMCYTTCTLDHSQTLNTERAERELGYRSTASLRTGTRKYVKGERW